MAKKDKPAFVNNGRTFECSKCHARFDEVDYEVFGGVCNNRHLFGTCSACEWVVVIVSDGVNAYNEKEVCPLCGNRFSNVKRRKCGGIMGEVMPDGHISFMPVQKKKRGK